MKTVTTQQMKAIDAKAIFELGIPSLTLMENAAAHTADAVTELLEGLADPRVTVLCGTGNNGGDGLACARLLNARGIPVSVFLAGDPAKLTPDAQVNARRLTEYGIPLLPYAGAPLPDCSCIVDALFGFGLNRELTGQYRTLAEAINAAGVPVVACDIPSGLNGNTGKPMGAAVKATITVTFTCAKVGLVLPEAAPYVGQLRVVEIGIPPELPEESV